MTRPTRIDGYAPIRDYAAIGNRRTVALVALDGSIDWLCLPDFDSPSVFAALLDARGGGRFSLAPEQPFEAERRYLPQTNVLETTFTTAQGSVRVTDALTLREAGSIGWNELVRRVEALAGEVDLHWRIEPGFDYGRRRGQVEHLSEAVLIGAGDDAVAVQSFGLGEAEERGEGVESSARLREGESGLIALAAFHDAPVLLSSREEYESRLGQTEEFWRRRAATCSYEGPWRDAVERSALALDLLTYAPTGAVVGAATTSLPEALGGEKNFDYRFSWLRDGNLSLDALLRLGYRDQVQDSFAWMMRATKRTHPRLRPFYRLDGAPHVDHEQLPFEGYRHSSPAMLGNGAGLQLQLGNFGDTMETAWLYVRDGNRLDEGTARRLAELADFVCEVWEDDDAGIWELSSYRSYTQSKIACWIALDRAERIAAEGQLAGGDRARWAAGARAIRSFVEERCWSQEKGYYARSADSEELDAALLLSARAHYVDPAGEQMTATIAALREHLGRGPLMYRYSGMQEQEGCFLACSFWLAEALARADRLEESAEVMDALVPLANDVGLLSEQIDPDSEELLGNFPQALTHMALINAAHEYVVHERSG